MAMLDPSNSRYSFLKNSDTLYSQTQRVFVKPGNGGEKTKDLRITIRTKPVVEISPSKVLQVQITDDGDCTLFYSLILTPEDFRVLKAQQGLLIEYEMFPSQLVSYLESCRSLDQSKFILVMDNEESEFLHYYGSNNSSQHAVSNGLFLKVIEKSNFKNLCHLSLKIALGTESDVRDYMAGKIQSLQETLMDERAKCHGLECHLRETETLLAAKSQELSDTHMKLAEERSCLRLETSQQLSEEREKGSRLQLEWQRRLEEERASLDTAHQIATKQLQEQITLLTFNNKNLYEGKCQLEQSCKEKSFQIEALERQLKQVSSELSSARDKEASVGAKYHERDKQVVELRGQLAVAEQEARDRAGALAKVQDHARDLAGDKARLEDRLADLDSQLSDSRLRAQSLAADLAKSNEILQKLQADLSSSKTKIKKRTDIALEQERILEKKSQLILSQSEAIKMLEGKVEAAASDVASLTAELASAKKTIEDNDVLIKKNESLINHLLAESARSRTLGATHGDPVAQPPSRSVSSMLQGRPPWMLGESRASAVTALAPSSATPTEDTCLTQPPSEKGLPTARPTGLDAKYFQAVKAVSQPNSTRPASSAYFTNNKKVVQS